MISALRISSSARVFVVISMLLLSTVAWADKRYIIDELSVNMRKGEGTDYAINAILKSGDHVTVLSDDRDSGYSKVRTADGKVGYVLTRFLSRDAPGRIQAERMKAETEGLRQRNSELEKQLSEFQSSVSSAQSENAELVAARDKLQTRLDWIQQASSNVVQIADENQKLREQLLTIESELTNLRQENRELKSWHKGQKVGAFILGIGMLLGWLIGRFRRRGSTWGDGL